MSFTVSFTCCESFAQSAGLAGLALVAGLLAWGGSRVWARLESDRGEPHTITTEWEVSDRDDD